MAENSIAIKTSITEKELRTLEQKDLTSKDRFFRRVTIFLPAIFLAIHLLEHLYFPSYKNYKTSSIYAWVIGLLLLALAVWIVLSYFSFRAYEKLRYQSALFVAIAVLLTAYDMATLKLGLLKLPYFPWVGKVLDAMVSVMNTIVATLQLAFTLQKFLI